MVRVTGVITVPLSRKKEEKKEINGEKAGGTGREQWSDSSKGIPLSSVFPRMGSMESQS